MPVVLTPMKKRPSNRASRDNLARSKTSLSGVFDFRSMRKVYAHSGIKLARFGPEYSGLLCRATGYLLVALIQPDGKLIGSADMLSIDEYLRIGNLR